MSLEECVAEFAKVTKVIRLMTSTAIQLVVTLTGLFSLCFVEYLHKIDFIVTVICDNRGVNNVAV